jgi:hypothetical protein
MSKINYTLFCAIIIMSMVTSCTKSSDSSGGDPGAGKGKAQAQGSEMPTSDDKAYGKLVALDAIGLGRLAQAGMLGECEMQDIGIGECNGETYALFLKDKGIYYPSMSKQSQASQSCVDPVSANVKSALIEGFCFSNHIDFGQMDKMGLGRRAQAGVLGNCDMQDVGLGECNGETFVLLLKNKGVYYPSMSKESRASQSCIEAVSENVKNAYGEGFCQ